MRIVFMGTPDFAAVSLQRLLDEQFDVVGVFTQPDKPKKTARAASCTRCRIRSPSPIPTATARTP